jgi:hypothetical protein
MLCVDCAGEQQQQGTTATAGTQATTDGTLATAESPTTAGMQQHQEY